jgi:peptidyl-prolyl cis-trans isomerase A (cyclophilin A)
LPETPLLRLVTPLGAITIALYAERAPKTVAHILALVEQGAFKGAHFYRATSPDPATSPLLTISVIQGGLGWLACEALPSVAHEPTSETGLSHGDGAVSIGRWADRGATSEIFICLGDQPTLDAKPAPDPANPFAAGFAVFGQVIEGMSLVHAIHGQPREGKPPEGHGRFEGQFLTTPVPFRAETAKPMQE